METIPNDLFSSKLRKSLDKIQPVLLSNENHIKTYFLICFISLMFMCLKVIFVIPISGMISTPIVLVFPIKSLSSHSAFDGTQ